MAKKKDKSKAKAQILELLESRGMISSKDKTTLASGKGGKKSRDGARTKDIPGDSHGEIVARSKPEEESIPEGASKEVIEKERSSTGPSAATSKGGKGKSTPVQPHEATPVHFLDAMAKAGKRRKLRNKGAKFKAKYSSPLPKNSGRKGAKPAKMPRGPVVVGIQGTELTPDDRRRLMHPKTGGVILFTRNFKDVPTLKALTDEIKSLRSPALAIMVDHEGGRVQRFKDGFARLPAMGFFERILEETLLWPEEGAGESRGDMARAMMGAGKDAKKASAKNAPKDLGNDGNQGAAGKAQESNPQMADMVSSGNPAEPTPAHPDKEYFATHPGAKMALYTRGDLKTAENAITLTGFVLASELKAMGVDISFTPVVDLDWGRSDIIGNRSFSPDPRIVTRFAKALGKGLRKGGMRSCLKHFPGHGSVVLDSHVGTPEDKRTFEEIAQNDLIPFKELLTDSTTGSIMSAHIVYPEVDSKVASFSRKWLKEILRDELGFKGAVFSDDLGMGGAEVAGDPSTRARLALQAGCDILLVCNMPEAADEILDSLPWYPEISGKSLAKRWKKALGGKGPNPKKVSRELAKWRPLVDLLGRMSEEMYSKPKDLAAPKVGE